MTALDAAIKEKRTADTIAVGREILAADPENLNVVYAVASQVRGEMLARPPVYDNAAAGVEFAQKGIAMVEAGKTLAGVATFDKNATLAWMTQVLALNAQKGGNAKEAIALFDKSTAYAPGDPAIAGQNLLRVVALRNTAYAEAAKAFNALPEADRAAAEPPPAVKAAQGRPQRRGRRPHRLRGQLRGLRPVQEPRRGGGRPGQPDARGRVQGALPGGRDARRPEEDPGRQGRAGAVARAPSETSKARRTRRAASGPILFLRADRGGGAPESLSW